MVINTKADIGQKVFTLSNNKVTEKAILNVKVVITIGTSLTDIRQDIFYDLQDIPSTVHEACIFTTKEDLLKSL